MALPFFARQPRGTRRQRRPASTGRRQARSFRPWLERLEDLTLLSVTNTWTGGGHDGLWKDAANWSLGLPTTGQDVVISNAGSTSSVTLDNSLGNVTVDSVTTSVNFNLTGGAVLLTTGGGSVSTGGVTLQGGVTLGIQGGSTLVIDGGSQSIGGSGTVTFDANTGNRLDLNGVTSLTLASGVRVNGQNGTIGLDFNTAGAATVVNNGVINASVAAGVITIEEQNTPATPFTVTNTNGTLEATNGGELHFDLITVNGGSVATDSGNGSTVVQDITTVSGSTVTGDLVGGPFNQDVLDGVTIAAGGVLDLTKSFARVGVTNGLILNGTVDIANSDALYFIGNTGSGNPTAQTLGGTGSVVFGASSGAPNILGLDGGVTLTIGPAITISGQSGAIGQEVTNGGTQTLINDGVIDASVGGGALDLEPGDSTGSVTNNSTLEATGGGTLVLDSNVTGGTFTTDSGHGSKVRQDNFTVSNCTIGGEYVAGVFNSSSVLSGATVGATGTLDLSVGQSILTVENGLTLNGTAKIALGSALDFQGTQTLAGSGVVDFTDNNASNALGILPVTVGGSSTLTTATNITVEGNTGTIGRPASFPGGTVSLVSGGTIDASVSGGKITLNPNGTLTNNGTFQVASGATLNVTTADTGITNYNTTTGALTGGSYDVAGTFGFSTGNITDNAANLTLDGPSAVIVHVSTTTNSLAALTLNSPGGNLSLLDGQVLNLVGNSFTNNGSVTIDGTGGASELEFGTYTQSGASTVTTLVGGGTLATPAGTTIQSGTFQGMGTVSGNLSVAGTVEPGTATTPGKIAVSGNYTQQSSGTLDLKLGGTGTAGTAYDLLAATGTASLSGTVNVSEVNGFAPQNGNTFQVVDFASESGDFTTKNGFTLGSHTFLTEQFNPTNLTLAVAGQETLHFFVQPAATIAGKAINALTGGVEVEVLTALGVRDTNDNTDQITLTANMNGLTGGGPVTVVNGLATFGNVAITAAANGYQLSAESTGLASAQSSLFNVAPDVLNKLVFTSEPAGTGAGQTLGSVVVKEEDQFNNVETGDNASSIALALAPNASALHGTIPQTVQGGVATFGDLSVSQAANGYVLTASTGGISQGSTAFNITAVNTTTVAAGESGTASQNVTLQATVTAVGSPLAVNEGTVNFEVFSGSTQIGSSVTSGTVTGGAASASFAIPKHTPAGPYTIKAFYTDTLGTNFNASQSDPNNNGTLTVASDLGPTQTAAMNAPATFSTTDQQVTLKATVTSTAGTVNEGTVTFEVFQGTTQIGSAVTSATVAAGAASASYTLPGGTAAGSYTIDAVYNPGPDFTTSSDNTHTLTVSPAGTGTAAANAPATFNDADQMVTLSATVTSGAGPVNGGTVTFKVFLGNTQIGTAATSGTVTAGAASASYTLPGGTAAGSYTIDAVYNPGSNFTTSSDTTHTLTVSAAGTTTTAANATATFSPTDQTVTLNATVTSAAGPVNGGTVSFTVFQGMTQIGTAATSLTVSAGAASASYTLPGGTLAGSYTIDAVYNPGSNLTTSSDDTRTLTVSANGNQPPVLPPINGNNTVTLPHNQFPFGVALNATSTDGNPLTYGTVVLGDSLPFDLQTQYRFTPIGVQSAGAAAYVLHSSQPGPGAAGYYLIRPADGALFAYDGSGSYAHTFQNGTPLGVLGANAFLDPSLLLNAQPPVNYATLFGLQQQYQFTPVAYQTAGTTAFVLHSNQPGPGFLGYYLLRSTDGALFAYDNSGNYATTFANGTALAVLGAGVYGEPALLLGAQIPPTVYPQLYQLNQQLDLKSVGGNHPVTADGRQALWYFSPILNQFGQHWYTLTPDGTLRAWQGYPDAAVGATLATLPTGVYANPAWLVNATAPPAPAATATVDASGKLTIGLPNNNAYAGTFKVIVTVTDGHLSTSQTVLVTATDTAPTLTITAPGNTIVPPGGSQSFPHLSFPQDDTVATTDAEGDTVTTTASASAFSLPFALEQQYRFTPVGYQTAGARAYVLQAPQANPFGDPYYLLDAAGNLYAYDGSGSYAHTFANVTPLAALGAATFNDPALLLGAQAPADYPTLYGLEQQYQFQNMGVVPSAGVDAVVLKTTRPTTAVQGLYLLRTDDELFAYDGSPTFAETFANTTPVANLGPAAYVNPNVLLGEQAPPGLYLQLSQLMQRYGFQPVGYQFAGATAYVLTSPAGNNGSGNPYYLLRSDGALFAYDGSGSYGHTFANSSPLATLTPAVFNAPSLLLNATAPVAAVGATANVSGGKLALGAPGSFVGTFQVSVSATDGIKTTTQTFLVNSTDNPPVPSAVADQTISKSGAPAQLALGATDAENDPVNFQAQGVGYNPAYALQQLYKFTVLTKGTDSNGVSAYVLHSNVPGAVNGQYVLSASGGVYAADGSLTFGQIFANPKNLVAQLTPAVFANPALLTNAQPPAAVPAGVVNVSGNTLTLNVSSLAVGTVFEVVLQANDGAETGQTSFLVTVTA